MNEKEYYDQQEAFLKGMSKEVALAGAEAYWMSMTSTFFRNPAQAIAELVDNANEADADCVAVHVLPTENKRSVDKIVVYDDGLGMKPEMIRHAMTYGGSQRHNSREGTGRFGMGLPNSTFTQADKVTVISKLASGEAYSVEVDGDLLKSGAYTKGNTIFLPQAKKTVLSKELESIVKCYDKKFTRGTLVILEKCSRMKIKSPQHLTAHLLQNLGVIFHKTLSIPAENKTEVTGKLNLFVNGERVIPADPLFLQPGAIGKDDDNQKTQEFESTKVRFTLDGIDSIITCEYNLLPPTYWKRDPKNFSAAKENTFQARFEIAKDYAGICIYRNNRLIDVISNIPKYVWSNMPKGIKQRWLNNDRTLRVSISFSPKLDEYFGVEVTKQQAMPSEYIWNKLLDGGFFGIISQMSKQDTQARMSLKMSDEVESSGGVNVAEIALTKLSKLNASEETQDEKDFKNSESNKNLESYAKDNLKKLNLPESKENIDSQKKIITSNLPNDYKIDFDDSPGGDFFRFDFIAGKLVIFINKDHEFYTHFYSHHETSAYARRMLDTFLGVMAGRMNATKDSQTLFKRNLRIWSRDLSDALNIIQEDHTSQAEEDDSISEENKEVKTS